MAVDAARCHCEIREHEERGASRPRPGSGTIFHSGHDPVLQNRLDIQVAFDFPSQDEN